jgi:hypothetical protein
MYCKLTLKLQRKDDYRYNSHACVENVHLLVCFFAPYATSGAKMECCVCLYGFTQYPKKGARTDKFY